ncbi:TPA: hypothetical protein JD323_001842 [Citrobacter amalonaticus]|nr:hypothetical protein [Citrobacter amalonaticus]HDQ2811380.1 hypothetical protein [Citrobacter amalonaticus]
MRNKKHKYVLALFFITISMALTGAIVVSLTHAIAKLYLFFYSDIPLLSHLPEFYKGIKAGMFGGAIAGLGCWCIYFWNRKQ